MLGFNSSTNIAWIYKILPNFDDLKNRDTY
jgi:hypothetical protein